MPLSNGNLFTADVHGTASNPITDPDAERPEGLTVVWWATSSIPANAQPGDIRISITVG